MTTCTELRRFALPISVSIIAVAVALPSISWAQEAAEAEDDVIVVEGFRSAFKSSLDRKREANQVLDSISAEQIGLFPDQNVAEALSRITGVQITRNNGEGETVSVRGLSPTFTRIEVDGRSSNVTIDSSDPERQSVLSVFASDLYTNIEVIKSPTAADIEGGIGGIVRLNTPDPLDVNKLAWGVDVGAQKGEARVDWEPEVTGFYLNTFADGRFGVLLSGTYELEDRSVDKIQSNGWPTLEDRFGGDAADYAALGLNPDDRFLRRLRYEQREGNSDKYNFNGKFQFQATDALRLSVNGLYTYEDRTEDRSRFQADFSRSRLSEIESGAANANGTVTDLSFGGRVRTEPLSFRRLAEIETAGFTAGFEYETDAWEIDGDFNFSSSEEDFDEPRASARYNATAGYSLASDAEYPVLFSDVPADEDIGFRDLRTQTRIISIEETASELNVKRNIDLGILDAVQVGARYSSTEFDRRQGQITSDTSGLSYADGVPFIVDGTFAEDYSPSDFLRVWPSVDPADLYDRFPSDDVFVFDDNNLYTIEENVFAGYAMTDFSKALSGAWDLRGNLGVRVVNTEYEGQGRVQITRPVRDANGDLVLDSDGNPTIEATVLDDARPIDGDYTEVLPSFNAVFGHGAESNLQLRLAAYRALARPTIDQINPTRSIDAVEDFEVSQGNPDLNPFTAWNYDAGIEYYFGEGGQSAITATFFYKDVEDFIAPTINDEILDFTEFGVPSQTYQVFTFENFGDAEIKGVEIGFQTPFYFLPGFWADFGIVANYTYTDSEATTGILEDGVVVFDETIPFPGASENSYNIVGYYERGGFSSRVAYNYRDEFLITAPGEEQLSTGETVFAQGRFGDEQGRLDIAVRYRFENGLRLSFDALNVTEEQNYEYNDISERISALDVEGRIYSFRIGYIF